MCEKDKSSLDPLVLGPMPDSRGVIATYTVSCQATLASLIVVCGCTRGCRGVRVDIVARAVSLEQKKKQEPGHGAVMCMQSVCRATARLERTAYAPHPSLHSLGWSPMWAVGPETAQGIPALLKKWKFDSSASDVAHKLLVYSLSPRRQREMRLKPKAAVW